MKRLLLSVCLIGLVFTGYEHKPLHNNRITPSAVEPLGNERAVTIVPKNSLIQGVALRSDEPTGILQQPLPEASVKEIFSPALPQAPAARQQSRVDADDDEGLWVVVIRGAWMHSGPSVAAPIVGHRSPGTDLHLIGQEQGWYQVSDPATGERGWIYARYYLEPSDGSGKTRVAVQDVQAPVVKAAPEVSEPVKPVRHVMQPRFLLAPPQTQAESAPARPRPSGESVASLLERALRR
jgi:hypothetical protein